MQGKKYDLEERLIDFSIIVLRLVNKMPNNIGSKNLSNQISRSSTSPALNYAEAQSAESDRDFLHKMKICLKELRETQVCLKIIKGVPYLSTDDVKGSLVECSELVAIFQKSISTKVRNMNKSKK